MSDERKVRRSPERAPDPELGETEDDDVAVYEHAASADEDEIEDDLPPDDDTGDDGDDDAAGLDDLSDAEIERLARSMGWAPREKWKGKAEDWRDAREFYMRAMASTGLHHRQYSRLEEQNRALQEKLDDVGKALTDINDERKRARQAGYDQAVRDLEARKLQAVEEADTEAYREADEELKKLSPPPAEPEPEDDKPGDAKVDPATQSAIDAWKAGNPWFDSDEEMTNLALVVHKRLARDKPGLTLAENLDEVAAEVRRRYPEKFGNPRRRAPSPVGGSSGNRRGRAEGEPGRQYKDLPQDARDACDRLVRTIPGYKREEYLRDYPWDKVQGQR